MSLFYSREQRAKRACLHAHMAAAARSLTAEILILVLYYLKIQINDNMISNKVFLNEIYIRK